MFGWLIDSDAMIFLIVILLSAFDFWTVKNITGIMHLSNKRKLNRKLLIIGRLLIGMRYRTFIDKDGKEIWVYESPN